MQLMHIKHKAGEKETLRLGLFIKNENGLIAYLDSKYISQRDVNLIRSNAQTLDRLDASDIIKWMKESIPDSFRQAYRTAKQNNCEIIKEIDVASISPLLSTTADDQSKKT
jgi:hypothetical protein